MNSLNSVLIDGNLTRDPKLSETPKGIPVCTFNVASNRFIKREEGRENEVSFFDVEAWSKLAENCAEYLKKGRGVRVVGRLKQDRWTDTEGKSHSRIKIVAEHVEFKPQFKGKNTEDEDQEREEVIEEKKAV
ncbi:MAG: single-stranded DNA-binding protein [Spirochaetes bacterium]|nr:MAG: single-stranded DNA-binding protein [Spirochaetota bacterium]